MFQLWRSLAFGAFHESAFTAFHRAANSWRKAERTCLLGRHFLTTIFLWLHLPVDYCVVFVPSVLRLLRDISLAAAAFTLVAVTGVFH